MRLHTSGRAARFAYKEYLRHGSPTKVLQTVTLRGGPVRFYPYFQSGHRFIIHGPRGPGHLLGTGVVVPAWRNCTSAEARTPSQEGRRRDAFTRRALARGKKLRMDTDLDHRVGAPPHIFTGIVRHPPTGRDRGAARDMKLGMRIPVKIPMTPTTPLRDGLRPTEGICWVG